MREHALTTLFSSFVSLIVAALIYRHDILRQYTPCHLMIEEGWIFGFSEDPLPPSSQSNASVLNGLQGIELLEVRLQLFGHQPPFESLHWSLGPFAFHCPTRSESLVQVCDVTDLYSASLLISCDCLMFFCMCSLWIQVHHLECTVYHLGEYCVPGNIRIPSSFPHEGLVQVAFSEDNIKRIDHV